jgi:hypothetical protein
VRETAVSKRFFWAGTRIDANNRVLLGTSDAATTGVFATMSKHRSKKVVKHELQSWTRIVWADIKDFRVAVVAMSRTRGESGGDTAAVQRADSSHLDTASSVRPACGWYRIARPDGGNMAAQDPIATKR